MATDNIIALCASRAVLFYARMRGQEMARERSDDMLTLPTHVVRYKAP